MHLPRLVWPVAILVLTCGHVYGASKDFNGNPIDKRHTHSEIEKGHVVSKTGLGPITATEGVLIFDDQDNFLAAAGVVFIEDFEAEPVTSNCSSGALPSISFDAFTAASAPQSLKILDTPCFGNHNTTPGGSLFLSADTDVGNTPADVILTFDFSINAFGLFLIDLEDDIILTILGNAYVVPAGGDGSEAYFGIVTSELFQVIELEVAGDDSHNSFDDIAFSVDLIFADGFESGNTSAWSSSVP